MGRAREAAKALMHGVQDTPLTVPAYYVLQGYYVMRSKTLGRPRVSAEDQRNVEQNITFIYKSFNRQRSATRLYRSIRSYYPGVRIIIADDSEVPLQIDGAEIIHLPFNSGLSKGLIAALERVETPYVVRLDDDLLLTPKSNVHGHLAFLQMHPEVDLCSMQMGRATRRAVHYRRVHFVKPLLMPAGIIIDGREVVEKGPNCFVARTEAIREVGWDPNIRMIDHHEFFWRAAGQIVCVQDTRSYVYHCHNWFDWRYRPYRSDYAGDLEYIRMKHSAAKNNRMVVSSEADDS